MTQKNRISRHELDKKHKVRKIAIYVRCAAESQEGAMRQKRRIKSYVWRQNRKVTGWGAVCGVYVDNGISGFNRERQQLNALLRDIERGVVDTVIATDPARISRSPFDFDEFVEHLEKNGSELILLWPKPERKIFVKMSIGFSPRKRPDQKLGRSR